MIRFIAILFSAVAIIWFVHAHGPIILIGLPSIVLAILFGELQHGQGYAEQLQDPRRSNQATDFLDCRAFPARRSN